jgi:hypothetical protein
MEPEAGFNGGSSAALCSVPTTSSCCGVECKTRFCIDLMVIMGKNFKKGPPSTGWNDHFNQVQLWNHSSEFLGALGVQAVLRVDNGFRFEFEGVMSQFLFSEPESMLLLSH